MEIDFAWENDEDEVLSTTSSCRMKSWSGWSGQVEMGAKFQACIQSYLKKHPLVSCSNLEEDPFLHSYLLNDKIIGFKREQI